MTEAHDQVITNHYVIHYPAHAPREEDPNYHAFNAYHRKFSPTAVCWLGERLGLDQCQDARGQSMLDQPGHKGIELHHAHIEFATINMIDLSVLHADFPLITTMEEAAAWAETAENFMWLCAKHHRGEGGIHHLAAADWNAQMYIRNLIGPFKA